MDEENVEHMKKIPANLAQWHLTHSQDQGHRWEYGL